MLYVCFLLFPLSLSLYVGFCSILHALLVPLFSFFTNMCMSVVIFFFQFSSPKLAFRHFLIFFRSFYFTSYSFQLVYNAVLSSSVCHFDLFIFMSLSSRSFSVSHNRSFFRSLSLLSTHSHSICSIVFFFYFILPTHATKKRKNCRFFNVRPFVTPLNTRDLFSLNLILI